jgi:hypothetical protein
MSSITVQNNQVQMLSRPYFSLEPSNVVVGFSEFSYQWQPLQELKRT